MEVSEEITIVTVTWPLFIAVEFSRIKIVSKWVFQKPKFEKVMYFTLLGTPFMPYIVSTLHILWVLFGNYRLLFFFTFLSSIVYISNYSAITSSQKLECTEKDCEQEKAGELKHRGFLDSSVLSDLEDTFYDAPEANETEEIELGTSADAPSPQLSCKFIL